jgi:hypothetical protein
MTPMTQMGAARALLVDSSPAGRSSAREAAGRAGILGDGAGVVHGEALALAELVPVQPGVPMAGYLATWIDPAPR